MNVQRKPVRLSQLLSVAIIALMITAVAPIVADAVPTTQRPGMTFRSQDRSVSITSKFPGGRMNDCVQLSRNEFEVTITPEIAPINDSAWYAFRVDSREAQSKRPRVISVRLQYVGGSHRYEPKISRDGKKWESAEDLVSDKHLMGNGVKLEIPTDGKPVWIAGQELLSSDDVVDWADRLSRQRHVKTREIGQSVEGRPLHRMDITEAKDPDHVFIIARQHPPEVTGAIGMMHFVNTLTRDTELANKFRQRYAATVIPTVNPDGVAHGNWRCNANGVDLNRDWSHFTQPETSAVRDEILACRSNGQKLSLFIDFHSTFDDVFYTQSKKSKVYPIGFTENWLNAIQRRFPNYEVNGEDNHNAHRSTSKAWVARALGVTAITYEFGDETDRETIRRIAGGAAEEMMRLLLAVPETDENLSVAEVAPTELIQVR